jgi:hypothetical protein
MKYSKTQDSVYCAPCRFVGPYVNCIRFQIKLNPLHIWQNNISKSTTYLYYIALLNILFLKIYVQKLTCCSWKLGFRGIIFSARKLQECRILHHLLQTPCRKATSAWPSIRLLYRFEYTSFWGSYAPDTDCTDSCKSNYHMITTIPRWHMNVVKTIITFIEILHHTLTILWYQEDESILNKKKKNCCSVSHYIFWWGMNMTYKMQLIFFGLLILALEFQLPFHFQIW